MRGTWSGTVLVILFIYFLILKNTSSLILGPKLDLYVTSIKKKKKNIIHDIY